MKGVIKMATLYAYSPNGTQATLDYTIMGFTQSLQQNGWSKLPNGLILQWRSGMISTGEFTIIYFPINFTNATKFCIAVHVNSNLAGYYSIINNATKTFCKIGFINANASPGSHGSLFFALGF